MSGLPPALSERIQRRIDDAWTEGMANWLARVSKERMNALPLQANNIHLWALRPDGTVLCLDFESASLPFGEELDPVARFAVLSEAARRYPELRELRLDRPAGVVRCDTCDGSGSIEATGASCSGCLGLGWHVQRRPIAGWVDRIDRGDRLRLRVHGGPARLFAGRLAGRYIARGDGLEPWSSPADARGRHQLENHLMRFGFSYAGTYPRQEHVVARWQPNPTDAADPFEGVEHALRFSGTGSGGSWEMEIARRPDGRYTKTVTLNNDWDPTGGGAPATETTELDEAAARAEVEREMRSPGRRNPFPAIVPRPPDETPLSP